MSAPACLHCMIMDTITAWATAGGQAATFDGEFVIGKLADAMVEIAMIADEDEAKQALIAFCRIQIDAAERRYHNDLAQHRASLSPPTSHARN